MHTVVAIKLLKSSTTKNKKIVTYIRTLRICINSLNRTQEMEREDLFTSCLITFISTSNMVMREFWNKFTEFLST